jgi:hypothetical protein
MIDVPEERDELRELEAELAVKHLLQSQGSLLVTGKAKVGFNPKATAKRRAKNRVASKSRRANRR